MNEAGVIPNEVARQSRLGSWRRWGVPHRRAVAVARGPWKSAFYHTAVVMLAMTGRSHDEWRMEGNSPERGVGQLLGTEGTDTVFVYAGSSSSFGGRALLLFPFLPHMLLCVI